MTSALRLGESRDRVVRLISGLQLKHPGPQADTDWQRAGEGRCRGRPYRAALRTGRAPGPLQGHGVGGRPYRTALGTGRVAALPLGAAGGLVWANSKVIARCNGSRITQNT